MELAYSVQAEQKTTITAEQIQSLEILAYDGVRLKDFLQKEYEENPCLEMTGGLQPSFGSQTAESCHTSGGLSLIPEIRDQSDPFTSGNFIRNQLDYRKYTDTEWKVINYLIGCLDDRGYLDADPAEIALELHTEQSKVLSCLKDLKELDPAGIFAQSLQECLALQLRRLGITQVYIYEMVDSYLEEVAGSKTEKLSRCLHISSEEAARCIRIIKKLNPFPMSGMASGETVFLVPDIILTVYGGKWSAAVNEFGDGVFSVSDYYANLLEQEKNPEVREYLETKLRRARMIIGYVQQRKETLIRITLAAADRQQEFFRGKGRLQPMKMADIAADTGLHESTVSRAVSGKYLQFPCGTILMRELFSRNVSEDAGFRAEEIKDMIQEIVNGEDRRRPLSDQKLTDHLKARNVNISRRAVAKYREEMCIPSSVDRRDR